MASAVFVRGLRPDEWEEMLALRIKSLQMHPGYFFSTPEKAKSLPAEDWKIRIKSEGQRIFGLFDGDTLIGITGIFVDLNLDPSGQTAHMVMSYIEPEYRGKGFSRLFYKARIAWALEQPGLSRIVTSHRAGNEPSKRSMIAHGFTLKKEEMLDWPDGKRDTNYMYELDLETLRRRDAPA